VTPGRLAISPARASPRSARRSAMSSTRSSSKAAARALPNRSAWVGSSGVLTSTAGRAAAEARLTRFSPVCVVARPPAPTWTDRSPTKGRFLSESRRPKSVASRIQADLGHGKLRRAIMHPSLQSGPTAFPDCLLT
jgi:hypothetical protein